MVTKRILLIEDFEPFRRFVRSMLAARPDFEVVGEVSDGLEAVRKVTELHPDLALLDVGLPSLDGFSVARQIRNLSPQTKIIFLTQERSADAMDEAALLGGQGYVIKTQALRELLPAIDAAFQAKEAVTATDRQHWVQFHPDDDSMIAGFVSFVRHALSTGKAVRAIVTASHQHSILCGLEKSGVNVAAAAEQGLYRSIDVEDALRAFMSGGRIDETRIRTAARALIAEAAAAVGGDPCRVAFCGECAPTLWRQGRVDDAIHVEHVWDDIVRTTHIEVLCPYLWAGNLDGEQRDAYDKLCSHHAAITWAQ